MLRHERDEANTLHEMRLLMGQIEEFAAHVREGLTEANWQLRRDIIRALVKRVEVTDAHITIVFRVGTHAHGPAPPNPSWQHWLPRLAIHAAQSGRSAPGCPRNRLRRSTALSSLRLNCHLSGFADLYST